MPWELVFTCPLPELIVASVGSLWLCSLIDNHLPFSLRKSASISACSALVAVGPQPLPKLVSRKCVILPYTQTFYSSLFIAAFPLLRCVVLLRSVFSPVVASLEYSQRGVLLEMPKVKRTLFGADHVQKVFVTFLTVGNCDTFYCSLWKALCKSAISRMWKWASIQAWRHLALSAP